MQQCICNAKQESADLIGCAAQAVQTAQGRLEEAILVKPDGTFSPQGQTAVTEVVVDAVTKLQGVY